MASSITLQKTGGGQVTLTVPDGATSEELNIPTTGFGTVLQTIPSISSAAQDLVISTEGTGVVVDTFNVTVQEGSRILFQFHTGQYIKSSATTNFQAYLAVNGTNMPVNTAGATDFNHIWYASNTYREWQTSWFITDPLSAGTHTLEFKVGRYNNGTLTMNYQGRRIRYLIQEIGA